MSTVLLNVPSNRNFGAFSLGPPLFFSSYAHADGCHVGHSGLRLRPAAGPCDYLPALDHFLRHLQCDFPDELCGRRGEGRLRAQQSAVRVLREPCGALSRVPSRAVPLRASRLSPHVARRSGALLPALWMALSQWLWWLCFGLANGTGNAVVYVALQVTLEQSFERRFGTAASIASLGMAIANVLLPFLWEALLALGCGNSASGSTTTTSAQHTAHGLSIVMYSIVFSYL